ncbi:ABC transporter permease [Ohtaekwangia koreensis]|uniref:Putative ABC transport system permease protein n=1 Tax=Ohtaekwangia koreensis TaxID=688867 RepID=A0A1T5LN78_9BACT|nr:ABC transporter permease [Ohtaekwangia koreensis]SKC77430.1 putative ABC transport system permease protein [Ohtaekwangia koreensis]
MVGNYFRIAWRHIMANKTFSFISIFGLSLSVTVFLLITQYAIFELRFDRFHSRANCIYRVNAITYSDRQIVSNSALSSYSLKQTMDGRFPEIVNSVRLISTRSWFDCTLKYDEGSKAVIFNEHNLYYTDASVLSIFSLPLRYGNAQALAKPYTAVLSESVARRYFGNEYPIGKTLHLKGSFEESDYTVTGVIEDIPADSHIEADIFLSINSLEHNPYVDNFDAYTYIQISPSVNMEDFTDRFNALVSKYLPSDNKTFIKFSLQPITEIHLYSSLQDEMKPGGNAKSIYFLILVAFSILLIAWINYINLATAQSIARAKEVGIRKVSGATRGQLVNQFLAESVIINLLSATLAFLAVFFLSSFFYTLAGFTVSYDRFISAGIYDIALLTLIVFCFGVFAAGFYPARIISSYNPVLVLKGKFNGKNNTGLTLRKTLVVFQFTCAIGLTIAVLTFKQQFEFMQRQDLGIDIARTVIVKAPSLIDSSFADRLRNFKSSLATKSVISGVTTSSAIPGDKIEWTGNVRIDRNSRAQTSFVINVVDNDFISTYKLKLLSGRDFTVSDFPLKKFGDKTESVILNKAAIQLLGIATPEEAIGLEIYWGDDKCKVVGVIDDFHQQSLEIALQPILFTANSGPRLSLKFGEAVNTNNLKASIAVIQKEWRSFFPDDPFDYFFLEDHYATQYADDAQIANIFQLFCGIAIIISGLGLFGLSFFMVRQRMKEMGIRKILGASVVNLITILTTEFVWLIILASCLAVPLAYLGITQWLQHFAFHMDLTAWIFVCPVLLFMGIGFITIGFQTFKAANVNPVKILKHE